LDELGLIRRGPHAVTQPRSLDMQDGSAGPTEHRVASANGHGVEQYLGPAEQPSDFDMSAWLRSIELLTIHLRAEMESQQMPLKMMLGKLKSGEDSEVRLFLSENNVKIPDKPVPRSRLASYRKKLDVLREFPPLVSSG